MRSLVLFTIILINLLGLMSLPILAFEPNESLLVNGEAGKIMPQSFLQASSAITFTPVTTIYLPITLKNSLASPIISNISILSTDINSSNCNNGGSQFFIIFDFLDPDGEIFSSTISTTAVFSPSGQKFQARFSPILVGTPGGGFKNTTLFEPCVRYDDQISVTITASLIDGMGFESNELTIVIPRPAGANLMQSGAAVFGSN